MSLFSEQRPQQSCLVLFVELQQPCADSPPQMDLHLWRHVGCFVAQFYQSLQILWLSQDIDCGRRRRTDCCVQLEDVQQRRRPLAAEQVLYISCQVDLQAQSEASIFFAFQRCVSRDLKDLADRGVLDYFSHGHNTSAQRLGSFQLVFVCDLDGQLGVQVLHVQFQHWRILWRCCFPIHLQSLTPPGHAIGSPRNKRESCFPCHFWGKFERVRVLGYTVVHLDLPFWIIRQRF
mmetsp:Transcript_13572/g.26318  ORF Transcript_13572/g.26318 Transcript_13572/m.26318 type:complete len:233 (-) Transcript_13572:321-1019(-)